MVVSNHLYEFKDKRLEIVILLRVYEYQTVEDCFILLQRQFKTIIILQLYNYETVENDPPSRAREYTTTENSNASLCVGNNFFVCAKFQNQQRHCGEICVCRRQTDLLGTNSCAE